MSNRYEVERINKSYFPLPHRRTSIKAEDSIITETKQNSGEGRKKNGYF